MDRLQQIVMGLAVICLITHACPADDRSANKIAEPAATIENESILKFLGNPDWKLLRDHLPQDRVARLTELAGVIREQQQTHGTARLTFICTHNSRRSQFAQVWAQTAARYFGLGPDRVDCYSGGTESTACNSRTIDSLRRSGFQITPIHGDEDDLNPTYLVRWRVSETPMKLSSKVYDQAGNPRINFIAVMCCSHAEEFCPIVDGSSHRISLLYDDPKIFDDSPSESASYDERSRQIAQEMWVVMGMVSTR